MWATFIGSHFTREATASPVLIKWWNWELTLATNFDNPCTNGYQSWCAKFWQLTLFYIRLLSWLLRHLEHNDATIILEIGSSNERWHYYDITPSFIVWAHVQNDPCDDQVCAQCMHITAIIWYKNNNKFIHFWKCSKWYTSLEFFTSLTSDGSL